jgi:aminoglycoside phosphotransferase (APT) family kinase protein
MSPMSDPPLQPVARWLSIDELRVTAHRDSEKHALQFCEQLINLPDSFTRVLSHAHELRKSKCTVDLTRIAIGGFSILFNLEFDDENDKTWVLRIRMPRSGELLTPEQQLSESMLLESEIATMRYVKENSSIPIPKVYGHDTSFTNPLGHPYMFLEMVIGTASMWATMSCTFDQRLKLIRNMANIINELATLTFPTIGQLRCINDGIEVGRLVTRRGEIVEAFSTSASYYRRRAGLIEGQKPADEETKLAIEAAMILAERSVNTGPFPLKHPDLSFQNVLVDENFDVVAILDWSFASTVPTEEFGFFHMPASPRLPFIVQFNEDQVTSDRQYFLDCLRAIKTEQSALHLSDLMLGNYEMELASYLAAFECNRPKKLVIPKLHELITRIFNRPQLASRSDLVISANPDISSRPHCFM